MSRRVRIITVLSDGSQAEMTHTLADTLPQGEADRYIDAIVKGLLRAGFDTTATVLTNTETPWTPR